MAAIIAGKPLILHTLLNAEDANSLDELIVATDDKRIADIVHPTGHEVIMTDPGLPSGSDRIWAAIRDRNEIDVIVNIQGDEPLLPVAVIDRTVQRLLDEPNLGVSTAACPLPPARHNDPNAVKVVVDGAGYALYFSRSQIPYFRSGEPVSSLLRLHVGLYVYRRDTLRQFCEWSQTPLERAEKLEQLRFLEHGEAIGIIDVPGAGRGVDTAEDLELVRKALGG
jgi:3-deoxy-manno-octulosonate cytidylyltransferase (CMP-KDO synthetase)